LPKIFIEPNNIIVNLINKSSVKLNPKLFNLNYEAFETITKDNLQIKGYKIFTKQKDAKGTIILLHGIRAYKEHFLPICKLLSLKGYNSIIIDLRGHGESEGKYCTFGQKEKQDISLIVDEIIADNRLSNDIGIWGQSLGAAISLQVLAIDKRIKYGIIESTFSDLDIVSKAYIKRLLKIENNTISNYLINRSNKTGDFDSSKIRPMDSAKKITQPILLVHGTNDKRINIKHAELNFKNLKSSNKIFLKIKDATHLNIWKKGGSNYFKQVFSFIDKH
jgi:alpha-beta hydrolase superfamily lysophospholipase